MIGEKVQHFQGKGTNLDELPGKIAELPPGGGLHGPELAHERARARASRRRRAAS